MILILHEPPDREAAEELSEALRACGAVAWLAGYANVDSVPGNDELFDLIVVLSSSERWLQPMTRLAGSLTASRMHRVVLVAVTDQGDVRPISAIAGFLRLRPQPPIMRDIAEQLVGRGPTPPVENFEAVVARKLREPEVSARSQVAAGGVRADFLIEVQGARIVVETNGREHPSMLAIAEATAEATRIAETIGAHLAFTVFAAARLGQIGAGALGIEEFTEFLNAASAPDRPAEKWSSSQLRLDMLENALRFAHVPRRAPETKNAKSVFAAMPFSPNLSTRTCISSP